jgi:hypothetical protein
MIHLHHRMESSTWKGQTYTTRPFSAFQVYRSLSDPENSLDTFSHSKFFTEKTGYPSGWIFMVPEMGRVNTDGDQGILSKATECEGWPHRDYLLLHITVFTCLSMLYKEKLLLKRRPKKGCAVVKRPLCFGRSKGMEVKETTMVKACDTFSTSSSSQYFLRNTACRIFTWQSEFLQLVFSSCLKSFPSGLHRTASGV